MAQDRSPGGVTEEGPWLWGLAEFQLLLSLSVPSSASPPPTETTPVDHGAQLAALFSDVPTGSGKGIADTFPDFQNFLELGVYKCR